jgi:hypothetical protein
VAFPLWSQQLRYGERTARGIAGGTEVTWAVTLRDKRRARSGKKIMASCDTVKDIALFRVSVASAPDKKTIEEGLATRRVERDSCKDLGKG